MSTDKALNRAERDLQRRMSAAYTKALRKALKGNKAFFKLVDDVFSGKKSPPIWYIENNKVHEWMQGFIREAHRKQHLAERIAADLAKCNGEQAVEVQKFARQCWDASRGDEMELLKNATHKVGIDMTFHQYDRRQLDVLYQQTQTPFSKIAFANWQDSSRIMQALQAEMMQATILGESQREIIARIRKVFGCDMKRAKRIAQTERTRIQSQARYQCGQQVADMGVRVYHEWSCKMMPTSRDTHKQLDGKCAMQGEAFPGSVLKFPGDPAGRPEDVINCYCVLIPGVLLDDEEIKDGRVVKRGKR